MKNKRIIIILIITIFAITLLISTIKIIKYINNNKENDEIQKVITEYIEIIPDNIEDSQEDQYLINFDELKKQNPDTVAYLKVPGTNIDYVVVKGTNNDYYLNHNFKKKQNSSGWVFIDYHNSLDGTDKNIVIYGHNMQNGSMFGTLHYVLEKDWQNDEENHKIIFITEEEQ